MFVDTAKVQLQAGKGGDGAVSFRHEIYIPKGGPDGGDGGRGGSIIFRADKDTDTLLDFRFNPILKAENGKNGAGQRSAGRSGEDLIVEVPIGTVVYRLEPSEEPSDEAQNPDNLNEKAANKTHPTRTIIADLTEDQQEAIIARGGDGGFGNAHFKSSTRQTPRIAEVGEPGEAFEAELELKLLADVGLVGLPNAGKSTFLSVVSNAQPEIADYPFTTLTPNLGVATIDGHDLLIADIPGLIEGAAEGKGLGHDFLRHIDRTAVLLHLVDVYNDDAGEAYATIRRELAKYSDLADRPEIVALTKTEGLDPEIIKMQAAAILAQNPSAQVYTISAAAHIGIEELLRSLREVIQESNLATPSHRGLLAGSAESERGAPEEMVSLDSTVLSTGDDSETNSSRPRSRRPSSRGRAAKPRQQPADCLFGVVSEPSARSSIPTISLPQSQLSSAWSVEKSGDKFIVTGTKIEKFARRTDLDNYESVNRLRDILKKLGIRAELTNQGATPDSIISIAGKEFTLVEDY